MQIVLHFPVVFLEIHSPNIEECPRLFDCVGYSVCSSLDSTFVVQPILALLVLTSPIARSLLVSDSKAAGAT